MTSLGNEGVEEGGGLGNEPAALAELAAPRAVLQEAMSFLGALCCGLEDAVGGSADTITYLAGRNLGRRLAANARQTDDITTGLEELRSVLGANGCHWNFSQFKRKASASMFETAPEGTRVMLVFRDCMIRQALFRYGHAQKGSLCNMMFGVFAGALEGIMRSEARLEIVHAGENACLKRLTIRCAQDEDDPPTRRLV